MIRLNARKFSIMRLVNDMTFLAPKDSSTIKTLTISPCLFFITVWDVAKIKNTWKAFGSLFDAGSLFVLSTSPLKLENSARQVQFWNSEFSEEWEKRYTWV